MTTDYLVVTVQGCLDNDSSPEAYRYQWYKQDENGAMIPEANSISDVLSYSQTSKGEAFQVEVTPTMNMVMGYHCCRR